MIDVRRFARWTTAARVRERTAGGAPVTYGLIALCGAIFLISR
ncbi:rhomboid family intramembrane serine protease, partial [Streptomyces cavourensis]